MEPETDFVLASIVGTGKSIDFYLFVKVGNYPLLALACACTFVIYCYCVLYLIIHCHCLLV